jgi:hypothetical protein
MEAVTALDPNAAVTPAVPRLRSNRRTNAPSIPPPMATVAAQPTDPLAVTTASSTAKHSPRSRAPLWIGGGLVVVAGALLFVAMRGPSDTASTPSSPLPAPTQPSPAPAVVVAPDAASLPEHVTITVEGAPPGTEVSIGGDSISVATPVFLPYGKHPVKLVFTADGYISTTMMVTADRDQTVKPKLKPRPRAAGAPRPHDRDDLLTPFK